MASRFADHILTGTHAARPSASSVPAGTIYSESDTGKVYQSDGAAWGIWLDTTTLTGYVKTTAGGEETVSTTAAAGSALTINAANGNVQDITLSAANCTLTLSAVTSGKGCTLTLVIRQDATGSRTVTWPVSVSWLGGLGAPVLQTAANSTDIVTLFTVNGGTTWYGFAASSIPTQHGCKVYSNAVQSIATSTNVAVTLNAEDFDTDGYHDTVTNNTRITIPTGFGGKYLLTATSFWNASPGSSNHLNFQKNGTTVLHNGTGPPGAAAAAYTLPLACVADLAAGDYIELIAFQTSGGSVNLGHASVVDAQSAVSAMRL